MGFLFSNTIGKLLSKTMGNVLSTTIGKVLAIYTVLISICIMPVSVKAGGNGTCCPEQGSICVIGSVSHSDYYYLESGPCPLPK